VAYAWSAQQAPAGVIQDNVERLAHEYGVRPWLDRTGIGWGVIENLSCPSTGVLFTKGNAVSGNSSSPNVPVSQLINNLVLGLEHGQIAIPAQYAELLLGLRAYRWKQAYGRKGRGADWVDALALAWWSFTRAQSASMIAKPKPRGM